MRHVVPGLRRVLRSPGWWLGTAMAMVVLAWLLGVHVRMLVVSAVGPFDALAADHLVYGTLDVLRDHPAVGTGMLTALAIGGLVGAVSWTLLSPLLIAQLAGHAELAALGRHAMLHLPGVVVQSLWHLPMRAIAVVLVAISLRPLPGWGIAIGLGIIWLLSGVALDASRVAVVEHDAAPYHPRTAWRGWVTAVKRPGMLLPCALLSLLQLAISAGIVWIALSQYGTGSPWLPRVATVVGVGLGLWRIAIVIEQLAADAGDRSE